MLKHQCAAFFFLKKSIDRKCAVACDVTTHVLELDLRASQNNSTILCMRELTLSCILQSGRCSRFEAPLVPCWTRRSCSAAHAEFQG